MKHQQVVVDYTVMIKSCLTCLMLAFSGYILIRLICTIFVLPKWIQKQQELENLKLQNQAMALRTKKFVQFLSTESAEKNKTDEKEEEKEKEEDKEQEEDKEDEEEKELENLNDDENVQDKEDVQNNEDENSNLEEKKDK